MNAIFSRQRMRSRVIRKTELIILQKYFASKA